MKHIGKTMSIKNDIINVYADFVIENFRSMGYNGKFNYITAIYQNGDVDGSRMILLNIKLRCEC
jgi:hypothetical protein